MSDLAGLLWAIGITAVVVPLGALIIYLGLRWRDRKRGRP